MISCRGKKNLAVAWELEQLKSLKPLKRVRGFTVHGRPVRIKDLGRSLAWEEEGGGRWNEEEDEEVEKGGGGVLCIM